MTILARIRFEEPPARLRKPAKGTKHERIAARLYERPGDWAHIASYRSPSSANSVAYMIRQGKIQAYAPSRSFEAVARTVEGSHRIYARYVGEGGEHA